MKLLFPNGEHSQVLLSDGVSQVGSAPGCQVQLAFEGVESQHAELHLAAGELKLRPLGSGRTSVNGAPISAETAVSAGDRLAFGDVQARLVAVERASSAPRPAKAEVDDTGATKLRMALPKLILRGVSGAAFGKTFPVGKEMIIGRQQDCDIPIPAEEVSRHHVRIKPGAEGLLVEDLGSANGTYINGKRVQQGLLKPGDELRLDSIRFMLIAPGMEIPRGSEKPSTPAPEASSGGSKMPLMIGVLVGLAAIAGAVWYFVLR